MNQMNNVMDTHQIFFIRRIFKKIQNTIFSECTNQYKYDGKAWCPTKVTQENYPISIEACDPKGKNDHNTPL